MIHLFLMHNIFEIKGSSLIYLYIQIFLVWGSIILLLQGNHPFWKIKKKKKAALIYTMRKFDSFSYICFCLIIFKHTGWYAWF